MRAAPRTAPPNRPARPEVNASTGQPRKVLAGLCAALFAYSLAVSSPHLVHHIFDPDRGAHCPVLMSAGCREGISPTPETLPPLLPVGRVHRTVRPVWTNVTRWLTPSRAPPR
jgi:hypothetical protein